LREIAGWLLVVIGLAVFLFAGVLIYGGLILTAPPIGLIGFFIFRGGIHILKVAVASRVSYRAQRELTELPRRALRKS
jgi:hypothetical protein